MIKKKTFHAYSYLYSLSFWTHGKITFSISLQLVRTMWLAMAKPFNCHYKTSHSWSFSATSNNKAVCPQKWSYWWMEPPSDWIARSSPALQSCPDPWKTIWTRNTRFFVINYGIIWHILTICGSCGTSAHGWPLLLEIWVNRSEGKGHSVCVVHMLLVNLMSTSKEEKVH